MGNYYLDNADLQFYVNQAIAWQPLVAAVENTGAGDGATPSGDEKTEQSATILETYRDLLAMMGSFTAEQIAPHAASFDRQGLTFADGEVTFPPALQAIFEQARDLELHRMCLPRELGGMNCPIMIYMLVLEMIARADVSVAAHYGFHGGMASAMLLYSIDEGSTKIDANTGRVLSTRFAKEIEEISSGKAWGCMDITEPHAGSDMAALTTKATQDATGQWYLTGPKIFITSGHGKYHFVIARTDGTGDSQDMAQGLAGLSLFLAKTYEDDAATGKRTRYASVDRIEEKLGHHASATCAISFDQTPAQLIGKRGEGFRQMLLLMNNARLGVGFEALGLCESAYRMAYDYACGRKTMGKAIAHHELIADYLDEMRTDIQALRALSIYGEFQEEMSVRLRITHQQLLQNGGKNTLESQNVQKQQRKYAAASRRVTPLVKFFGAEKAVEIARRNLQIHGGSGYTKDYGAEKLLRDALVLPIYEGTTQIQALMAMKDCLTGIIRNPQRFVKRFAQARVRGLSSRDPLERRVARMQSLSFTTQQHLLSKTAAGKLRALSDRPIGEWPQTFLHNWDPKRDFAFAMLHAERLTRILTDTAICEVLLDQAKQFPERRELLERYIERAEPRCHGLHMEIVKTGGRLLETLHKNDPLETEDQGVGVKSA